MPDVWDVLEAQRKGKICVKCGSGLRIAYKAEGPFLRCECYPDGAPVIGDPRDPITEWFQRQHELRKEPRGDGDVSDLF